MISETRPDEIYNLAAQSFVGISFEQPLFTTHVNAIGPLHILETVRGHAPNIKFYQASTSEMFGKVLETPQTETTPFNPQSPYAIAKLYAHWMTSNYRTAYDIFACSGILFNHESPLRGEEFVTRKITSTFARIACGSREVLELGNLNARRDWGYAGDYVRGMWMMLQAERPCDYVLATGVSRTVQEFVNYAAASFGFDLVWQGTGVDQVAIDRRTNRVRVAINPQYFRPAEVDVLIGNARKAQDELSWRADTTLENLVEMMCRRDFDLARKKAA